MLCWGFWSSCSKALSCQLASSGSNRNLVGAWSCPVPGEQLASLVPPGAEVIHLAQFPHETEGATRRGQPFVYEMCSLSSRSSRLPFFGKLFCAKLLHWNCKSMVNYSKAHNIGTWSGSETWSIFRMMVVDWSHKLLYWDIHHIMLIRITNHPSYILLRSRLATINRCQPCAFERGHQCRLRNAAINGQNNRFKKEKVCF